MPCSSDRPAISRRRSQRSVSTRRILCHLHLKVKVAAEGIDVASKRSESVSIVPALLDSGNLCLRYTKAFGHLSLGQSGSKSSLDELEPQLLLGCFLLIGLVKLGISQLACPVVFVR